MENKTVGKFGRIERDLRILFALSLTIAFILQALPPWMAFATVYLFTTAMFTWDPFYAFLQYLLSVLNHRSTGLEPVEEN